MSAVTTASIDVNCDMGEGFGHWVLGDTEDDELIALISSANIATGFHAGDPTLMDHTVQQAKRYGVGVGAHPGFRDLQGFGRRFIDSSPDELVNDVVYQVGALREFTRRYGVALQHVKPHGALYMHAAGEEGLSQKLVEALQQSGPDLYLFCMGASVTYEVARRAGHPVVREFYADRDYDRSGSIVFKRKVIAPDPQEVADRVMRACLDGRVRTVEGDDIEIAFESVCFHSDTPGSLKIARALRRACEENGIRIAPVSEVMAAA